MFTIHVCSRRHSVQVTPWILTTLTRSTRIYRRYPSERYGVVLCAAYDAVGRELPRAELVAETKGSGLPVAPLLGSGMCVTETDRVELEKTVEIYKNVDGAACEGCVIRFQLKSGGSHRVKIKSSSYQKLFKLQDSLTPRKAFNIVRAGAAAMAALERDVPAEFVP